MSFIHAIADRLENHPCRTVVTEGTGQARRTTTAATLLSRAARFRRSLQEAGVCPGDRIGLVAANSADWIAFDLAVLAEGAVLVPLDVRQLAEDLTTLLRDAQPTLIATDPGVPPLKVAHQGKAVPQRTLAELATGGGLPWLPPAAISPDALATIIYTSGSSGEPKGAMLTRENMSFMLSRTERRLAQLTGLPLGRERALHYLPLCYAGSRILLLSCLLRVAHLEVVADPKQLADVLTSANADYFLNVPLVLERFQRAALSAVAGKGPVPTRLLREAQQAWARVDGGGTSTRDQFLLKVADRVLFAPIRARFGDRLRGIICGSAPLAQETQDFYRMLGVEIYQGYGLTETTALCTLDAEGAVRPGWVGPALPGVEMRRSDAGEIETRGPHIFAGYWGRPQPTQDAFTDDGWFRTGDLGEVDALERWRISGRQSAVLVLRTGHNVAPEPLEEALRQALVDDLGPALADAQVVILGHGQPHLIALLAAPEGDLPEARIRDTLTRLNPTLPKPKQIHRFQVLEEPFSNENGLLTANLKLRRKAIAERYADAIQALYNGGRG